MKMPLAWHEECLRNHQIYYEVKKKELARMQLYLETILSQLLFHYDQLAAAKARGLEAYDFEKLLVPRKKK